jgi:membrane-associated protease RseP (regulator of RpoE activity)
VVHPVEIPPSGPSGIRTVEAPSGANAAAASDSPAPATSAPSASVSASSGAPAAAARTPAPRARAAQDKQTLDARALADIMTADGRGHAVRIPPPAALDHAPPAALDHAPPAALDHAPPAALGHAPPAPVAGPAISGPPTSDSRTAAAPPGAIVLSHGALDGALADFAALASAIHGSFSAAGLAVDQVADGTIFQRAGLRAGDLVTAVDGVRLRSLDDAAVLYARAPTANAITAQIVRDGKPMTLHVVIR